MSSIFQNDSAENPITLVRQTLKVLPAESGEVVATFTVNKGKGSGAQVLPFAQYRDAVAVLVDAAKNGIPEMTEEENLPAAEVIRRTLSVEDGIVSFRVKSGKGAKPARLSLADFKAVAELLHSTVEAVETAGKALAK